MCDSNTDMDILNTTDVEAGHKIDKASMEEVGTFTGDDLSFAVVGSSSTDVEEKKVVASASTGAEEKVVVVKEEDVDFGDAEVVDNTEPEGSIPKIAPRKDLLVLGKAEGSEAEPTDPSIHQLRRTQSAGRPRRSKSRSNRARSTFKDETAGTAPKRAASRPPPKERRGRSKAPPTIRGPPIKPLPYRQRSPEVDRRGTREILIHTPTLAANATKQAFLAKTVKDYPLTGWAEVNFHIAGYYHLPSEKYPLTHPRQLMASAIRRDATLSHRWLCWRCNIPNDRTWENPHLTSKYAFKTEGEVSYHWWNEHSSDLIWEWYNLALYLGISHEDIMGAYGIDLEEAPWPIGSALEVLPIHIPSRGKDHNAKLWYPPYNRKQCAASFASEQGLPWSQECGAVKPTYPPEEQKEPERFPQARIDASLATLKRAEDRGFTAQPGVKEHIHEADVTFMGWIDPIDLYHGFLNPELELLCVGHHSIGEYGESRRTFHKTVFGNTNAAHEFMRLEEHAFYTIVYKLAATKITEGLGQPLSSNHKHLAVSAVSFCAPELARMLLQFLDAEAKERPLSSKSRSQFKAVVEYIELATAAALPLFPENAPRAPGENGKLNPMQRAALLL